MIAGLEGRYFTNLNFYHLKHFFRYNPIISSDIPTPPHATRSRTVCGMWQSGVDKFMKTGTNMGVWELRTGSVYIWQRIAGP